MRFGKKTKIICTIGPATSSEKTLSKLLHAGMNIARLNFSHGDFAEHQEKVENLKLASKASGIPVGILQDLAGPKIRIGDFSTESINLKEGEFFTLTTEKIIGDQSRVHINYPPFPKEVKVGGYVLLHDGRKKLEVVEINGEEVKCKIIVGGDIKGRRGVNLPGARLSISSLTDKDRKDIEFGIKNKVDFVALSFARRSSDIEELREILVKAGSEAHIIAKVEDEEAIENIDNIIKSADAIMIGRGDLATEIGAENMPLTQKMIISKCNKAGKPVVTATQMLESMIKSPMPTRAEVSDIANAILEGTDAIMLSEETTLGEYPVQAVEVMTRVAKKIEAHYPAREIFNIGGTERITTDAVSTAVVATAKDVGAKLIIAFSISGFTARMISRLKPKEPIIVLTPNEKTRNHMMLSFGCFPIMVDMLGEFKDICNVTRDCVLEHDLAKKGDKVVIAGGIPFGQSGATNMLIVEKI